MYQPYWAVFYAQPLGKMVPFSTFCHAPLGFTFYKIHASKRHTKSKYVKLK